MKNKGLNDVLLTGGGIIPENDMTALNSIGVGKLFGPGTPVQDTIDYITDWVQTNRR
jgi:methylmalonyl-CoA mutase C-terminal domain/subunit